MRLLGKFILNIKDIAKLEIELQRFISIDNNYKGTDSEYKDIFSVDPEIKIGQGKGYFYTLFIIWLVSLPLSIGIIILGLLKIN